MMTACEEVARLSALLRGEHHALAEFLVALARFDAERRWVGRGHRTLFDFLVRELGLSAGAAFYRKTAAALIQDFPEVVEPLRDGRLCPTTIVELAKSLTRENLATVLPRFFRVSKREAKALTAELNPVAAPPLRTVVTAVGRGGAGARGARDAAAATAPDLLTPEAARTARAFHPDETPGASAGIPDVAPPAGAATGTGTGARGRGQKQPAEVQPLTGELSRLHVTVSRRLLDKLAAARDALSHSHPGASEDTILEVGLDLIIDRHRKRRGIGAKPRARAARATVVAATEASLQGQSSSTSSATSTAASFPASSSTSASTPPVRGAPAAAPKRSRYVLADVWRAVWERDGARCAWPLEGGGVCGSTHQLELDHVDGWALGAGHDPDRLRLLCRVHQDVHARRLYGDDVMNRYTRSLHAPRGGAVLGAGRGVGRGVAADVDGRGSGPRRGRGRGSGRG